MEDPNVIVSPDGEIDLDVIESAAEAFGAAKAKASPGRWHCGAWFDRCRKHADGKHRGLGDPIDPCVISHELTTSGDHASYVSTENNVLIGSDSEGPVLSPTDAEFIAAAKNIELDLYIRVLVAEVRRLREFVSKQKETRKL
jgi:hypothetical protein